MSMPSRRVLLGIVALAAAHCARPAQALVVVPPDVNQNTSAPAADPGWLNVGSSGVYVGNQWVLTVRHIGNPTSFNFPGVGSYSVIPGSQVPLTNPAAPDRTEFADLAMYRLAAVPSTPTLGPLPSLVISDTTPAIAAELTLIGSGRAVGPAAQETHWNVTGTEPNLMWQVVDSGGNYHGYQSGDAQKLWGRNRVENDVTHFPSDNDADHVRDIDSGSGDVISFITDFDRPGDMSQDAIANEAQAMGGDSGSAAFVFRDGGWQLAGITHAVELEDNQPGGTATAVYGNLTYIADLSAYRTQINAIAAVPEVGGALFTALAASLGATAHYSGKRIRMLLRRPGYAA